MYDFLKFIGEHFTIYAIFLILICSYILIFVDSKQLKANDLKKESSISFAAGIAYAALAIVLFILTQFFMPIK